MKKLGFGCMRLPLKDAKDQTSIDLDKFSALVDLFLEKGFTYFDTAYMYHGGASERAVKACLVDRHPRESFQLATKLFLPGVNTAEDAPRIFNDQLNKCGVTYFDYYLLHNMGPRRYDKVVELGCIDYLLEQKKQGRIRKLGFSYHGNSAGLERILSEQPMLEFVQLQLNYLDWEDNNVQSRRCYEVARSHGIDIIVMEPCKGGELATAPEQAIERMKAVHPDASPASWAFRYVGALEGVIMVLSGMNSPEQILDNAAVFDDLRPLTEEERDVIAFTVKLLDEITPIRCTTCRYCEDGCPMRIPIPDCFSTYNRWFRTHVETPKNSYRMSTNGRGKASDCIGCRACVDKCPQNLSIPELLKDVAAVMEA